MSRAASFYESLLYFYATVNAHINFMTLVEYLTNLINEI